MAVMKFKALAEGHSNPVWTSKAWLEDWLKDNPSMHVAGTEEDAPPDDPVYQADVICEHDGLNPDEKYRCLITGRVSVVLCIRQSLLIAVVCSKRTS